MNNSISIEDFVKNQIANISAKIKNEYNSKLEKQCREIYPIFENIIRKNFVGKLNLERELLFEQISWENFIKFEQLVGAMLNLLKEDISSLKDFVQIEQVEEDLIGETPSKMTIEKLDNCKFSKIYILRIKFKDFEKEFKLAFVFEI